MRLYVICYRCGAKIFIQSTAKVRSELPLSFQLTCFHGHQQIYSNYEVLAEPEVGKTPAGIIIGGLLGALLFGPIGALGGAALLGGAGASAEAADKIAVERFNTS